VHALTTLKQCVNTLKTLTFQQLAALMQKDYILTDLF